MSTITQVIYKSIPTGAPTSQGTFDVRKVPFDPTTVEVPQSHVLVKTLYLSVDPYLRFRMRDTSIESYFPAAQPGKVFGSGGVVEVIRSNHPKYEVGQVLVAYVPWQEYSVISLKDTDNIYRGPITIPDAKKATIPLSYYLGVLGMTGITAYAGLQKVVQPIKAGETIYISAASGAVGQIVGQYAKTLGLRVVGSAGSEDKVNFLLKDLGFDAAFNYKKHKGVEGLVEIMRETCPQGIDIYFENVGGDQLDAVLEVANDFARVAICGMVSQYNLVDAQGIKNLPHAIGKRIRLQGFLISDYEEEVGPACVRTFSKLLGEGTMKYKESVTKGIENAPQAFVDMLEGKNFGKAVVKVAELK